MVWNVDENTLNIEYIELWKDAKCLGMQIVPGTD